MSLLRKIQDAAIDSKTELATMLRMCKVLAVRLGHDAFKSWVDQELNGYTSKDELPSYRVFRAHSKGNFSRIGGIFKNMPIPPSTIPDEFRKYIETAHFSEGVGAYESLSKQASKESKGTVHIPWPADMVRVVGSEIYQDMYCIEAWMDIPVGRLIGLLDTVRNRVLNFVLEIEGEDPEAGEAKPGKKPIPDDRINQFYTIHIEGGTQNVAIGSSDFSQTIHQRVLPHDLESLKSFLSSSGVAGADIEGLEAAIRKDGNPEGKELGANVTQWIGRMTAKAASGLWKAATSTAVENLPRALLAYYDLSP